MHCKSGAFEIRFRALLYVCASFVALGTTPELQANILNTGFLSSDALSQGMGGAHAALGGDPEDYILNPADIAETNALSLDVQGGDLFSTNGLLGGSLALPPLDGLVGLVLGNQSVWTQASGNDTQIWSLGFGIPLQENGDTALGATVKYFSENYGDPGSALGLDFGALQRFHFGPHAVSLSLSILDFDSQVQHNSGLQEPLPQIVKGGLAYSWSGQYSLEVDNDWADAGETFGENQDSGGTLHIGAEAKLLNSHAALRAGYVLVSGGDAVDAADSGSNGRYDLGLSLGYGPWHLDYAFMPSSGALEPTHRLGLTYDLYEAPKI